MATVSPLFLGMSASLSPAAKSTPFVPNLTGLRRSSYYYLSRAAGRWLRPPGMWPRPAGRRWRRRVWRERRWVSRDAAKSRGKKMPHKKKTCELTGEDEDGRFGPYLRRRRQLVSQWRRGERGGARARAIGKGWGKAGAASSAATARARGGAAVAAAASEERRNGEKAKGGPVLWFWRQARAQGSPDRHPASGVDGVRPRGFLPLRPSRSARARAGRRTRGGGPGCFLAGPRSEAAGPLRN
jgi:hypothetical protein